MRILALPYSHVLSHISRPLAVAKELRARGHEVLFAGESSKMKIIEHEGFSVFPVYEPDPVLLFGNIHDGKIKFTSDNEIERMIDADLKIYRKIQPDLVLTDFRFTAPISTDIAKLRHAAIVNASSTEYRALPYIPFFEWIPDCIVKRDTKIWGKLDALNLKIEMLIFDNVMNIFKKLSKRHGIRRTVTATNCLTGKDITLLADIPGYFPTKDLPFSYHYVGPLTWKSNIRPPLWWPPSKGENYLIYVTMGTTGLSDFFDKVFRLFAASGINAIITTGAQVSDMKTLNGKIYVESFMDGDLAMRECDLVVCHGGNGTIYQALNHGKPIIGIPTLPDQQFNMRMVERLGVGRRLSWEAFSREPSLLLDLINSVLKDNTFFNNAAKMKEILGTYDAPKRAADIITGGNL